MDISWTLNPTIIVTVIIQIILLVATFVRTSEKASRASREVVEAKTSVSALNAAFNLFQVSVARDYISRDVLREFEQRIMTSSRENADRLSRDISELREAVLTLSQRS